MNKNKNIKNIAIIGRGKMGSGISLYLLKYDFSLLWICRRDGDRKELEDQIQKKLKRLLKSGQITSEQYEGKKEGVTVSSCLDDAAPCDLVIESITEDLEAKRKLFAILSNIAQPNCIFTSNTSSISLMEIYQYCSRSRMDKCAGLHFFDPVSWMNILEINATSLCSSETIKTLRHFAESIEKEYLILPESGNFLLNRIISLPHSEAYHIFLEGALSIREIDDLTKEGLFPIGPFEFMDGVGPEIILKAAQNYGKQTAKEAFYAPLVSALERLVDRKCHFYSEPPTSFEGVSSCITGEYQKKEDAYRQSVLDRLTGVYLNAVFDAIAKGYCNAAKIDNLMKEYLRGDSGPLTLANRIGHKKLYNMLIKQYEKTGNTVYLPSPAIKRNIPCNN